MDHVKMNGGYHLWKIRDFLLQFPVHRFVVWRCLNLPLCRVRECRVRSVQMLSVKYLYCIKCTKCETGLNTYVIRVLARKSFNESTSGCCTQCQAMDHFALKNLFRRHVGDVQQVSFTFNETKMETISRKAKSIR